MPLVIACSARLVAEEGIDESYKKLDQMIGVERETRHKPLREFTVDVCNPSTNQKRKSMMYGLPKQGGRQRMFVMVVAERKRVSRKGLRRYRR